MTQPSNSQSPNFPISQSTNPYVGPRTFTEREGRFFFGREREARDLTARIVSERLLLFYGQSGAGWARAKCSISSFCNMRSSYPIFPDSESEEK